MSESLLYQSIERFLREPEKRGVERVLFQRETSVVTVSMLYKQVRRLSKRLSSDLSTLPEDVSLVISHETPSVFMALNITAFIHAKSVIIVPNLLTETVNSLQHFVLLDHAFYQSAMADPCDDYVLPLCSQIEFSQTEVKFFTSGTTGHPSVVYKKLYQLEAEVNVLASEWGDAMGSCEQVVSTVPHHHIYGYLFSLLLPLSIAVTIYDEKVHYFEPLEAITQRKKTALVTTPVHISRINRIMFENETVALTFSSGGKLAREDAIEYKQRFSKAALVEILGSTETGGIAFRTDEMSDVWQFFSCHECKVVEGVLSLKSPYLAAPTVWYRTNEKVELIDNKRFKYMGRIDTIIKIEGKRIAIDEYDAYLSQHEFIAACQTIDIRTHRDILAVTCVLTTAGNVVLEHSGRIEIVKRLKLYLSQKYDNPLIAKKWNIVDELPVDERGKCTKCVLETGFVRMSAET